MTDRKSRDVGDTCPTCGGTLARGPQQEPLAWVRRLARRARQDSPPNRLGEARQMLEELFALPVAVRVRTVEREPERFASRLLLRVAFHRIEAHFPRTPRQALEELEVVHALATLLDDSTPEGRRFRVASVALTWAHKTSALLGIADLFGADRAIRIARDLAGSDAIFDLRAGAFVDRQEGRVRLYQHRFDEAERLLARAARNFLEAGDPGGAALALLNLAEAQRMSLPDEALSTLAAAEKIIDPFVEAYVYLCCQMERALVLCELGEGLAADLLMKEHEAILQDFSDIPSVPLRTAWLRGRIALLLAKHDQAVLQYEEARRLALEEDDAYDAALVSLELALVHLDRADLEALREEAVAILPILAAESLHEAAGAALSLYRDALLRQQAGRALIHRLTVYFETARLFPGRRFRPE